MKTPLPKFTVYELLVLVVFAGLLAAIGVPAYESTMDRPSISASPPMRSVASVVSYVPVGVSGIARAADRQE